MAEVFEADATLDLSAGEAGDPNNWPALPPTAVIASTYLRLSDDADSTQSFDSVLGPIIAELMAPAPGLMGLSTSASEACGSLRTLSAWESEEAMMNFVVGEAHLAAIGQVSVISRGGSVTGSWSASELESVSWEAVVAQFADHTGPAY
ncbi:hypothetical protein DB30_05554 [Enhygromyxa salina]|uniref:ABM domain-containing protein n=1 Tax=Enhygromyxa salina TaxID=215803 RepID=A0A0C2CWX2_9BACT|nr:hypothetical protein DB30_05554 [Enhygromyxa salina]